MLPNYSVKRTAECRFGVSCNAPRRGRLPQALAPVKSSLDSRSILFGACSFVGGYFICTLCLLALSWAGTPGWLWVALAASIGILVSALSGFIGALFAPDRPLIHGTVGPTIGAFVLLLITILGVRTLGQSVGLEQAPPFLAAVALAFCGALFAVHVWPRHGL